MRCFGSVSRSVKLDLPDGRDFESRFDRLEDDLPSSVLRFLSVGVSHPWHFSRYVWGNWWQLSNTDLVGLDLRRSGNNSEGRVRDLSEPQQQTSDAQPPSGSLATTPRAHGARAITEDCAAHGSHRSTASGVPPQDHITHTYTPPSGLSLHRQFTDAIAVSSIIFTAMCE